MNIDSQRNSAGKRNRPFSNSTRKNKMKRKNCPFDVGDYVRFTPSKRTLGLYQNIERFGVAPGEVRQIESIKDGIYLYFGSGQGGWPWSEFALAKTKETEQQVSRNGAPSRTRRPVARNRDRRSE